MPLLWFFIVPLLMTAWEALRWLAGVPRKSPRHKKPIVTDREQRRA